MAFVFAGRWEWPIGLALLATVAVAATAGAVVQLVALRPLGRFDPTTNVGWIVTTFAVGLVAIDLVSITVDSNPHTIPPLVQSVFGWEVWRPAGVPITAVDAVIVVTTLALVVALDAFQRRTMLGRAFRAVAQDPQTASLMGVNPQAVVVASFALAGALAAIGAVLLAPKLGVQLGNGATVAVQAFIAAVIGGLGSTRGAIVGGYAIGITSAAVKTISASATRYEPLAVFVLFLLVLVVRPAGVFGARATERV